MIVEGTLLDYKVMWTAQAYPTAFGTVSRPVRQVTADMALRQKKLPLRYSAENFETNSPCFFWPSWKPFGRVKDERQVKQCCGTWLLGADIVLLLALVKW
jgi:hypothetical protein